MKTLAQNNTKVYNFKKHILTADEKIWLNELLLQDFNKIDLKITKVKVWGKVSKDFDPSKVDYHFASENRLTLLGLWYVDPKNILFDYCKKVIDYVITQLKNDNELKTVNSILLSESLVIPLRDVQITLTLLNDLGFFSGGSHQGDVIIFNEVHFYHDHTGYDKYLSYKSLEDSLEDFYNQFKSQRLAYLNSNQHRKTKIQLNEAENIWDEISSEYNISKQTFGKKFNFVRDKNKRKIIFRDIQQAYILSKAGYSKPAIILAGGVIEELLRLYLINKGHNVNNKSFDDYIKLCQDNGYLKIGVSRLSDSTRYFRNLVHLSREDSPKMALSQATAKGVVSSIFTIVNDF